MFSIMQRRTVVHEKVGAYNNLKSVFTAFSESLQKVLSKDTLYRISFMPESPSNFTLIFFDRVAVDVDFTMVMDEAKNPHGRLMFTSPGMNTFATYYFDNAGNLTNSICQRISDINMLDTPGIDSLIFLIVEKIVNDDIAFEVVKA